MPFQKGCEAYKLRKKNGRGKLGEEVIKQAKDRIYKEVFNELLPNRLLAEKHLELLTVPKKVRHYKKGDLESEYEEVDSQAISKGLDMAYKIKGEYAAEKIDHTTKGEKIIGINYINPDGNNDKTDTQATPGISSTE